MRADANRGLMARIIQNHHFYLFISPFFVLFAIFGLYPLLFSAYLSFTQWDGMSERQWVGLSNLRNLLHDDIFFTSLWNTVVIAALYIPPMFVLAFGFALLLNQKWLRARAFLRASIFAPCITPMVVIAIVFSLLFSPQASLLNYAGERLFGLVPFVKFHPIPWLTSEAWSKVAVAILVLWRWTGYNMILMLAGLQGIPETYYEAARIDGATAFQRVFHITLPLMRPTFVYCAVMSLIGSVYMFDEVFVLTGGGPGTSSTNFGLYLFNLSFTDFRFGYASAAAYTVAFVVFFLTILLTRYRKSN